MSKLFASVLMSGAMLCWSGAQVLGQTPLDERADRKANGTDNVQSAGRDLREPAARTTGRRPVQDQAVQQGQLPRVHTGYTQHDLATMLEIANDGEVKVSQLGVDKAKHDDVKQFAQEMVKVHTEMIAKIRQSDAAGIAAADRPAGQAPANNADNAAGRRSASVEPGDSPFVSLKRELAAQCLQSKQEELGKKDGAEFDRCFMGAQLGMHMEAIDTMKVFQRHTSGELRQTIDDGIKTAEQHLEHAKKIMKDLETAAK